MQQLNGSQMISEAFKAEGVDIVFGYPGGAVLNIYDETYKQTYFRHILVRHEQAAIHAADGYARASGKVGVAFVTSGPGITNAITGLATAYMDSIPIVVISGQVSQNLLGTDAFQEIDAIGITRSCVKHNYLVTKIDDLPRILKEAFYIARSGRPGPVHIDIPKNLTAEIGNFEYPQDVKIQTYNPIYDINSDQIQNVADVICQAKQPILYIGGGAILSNAVSEIRQFVDYTHIPATQTLMGLGTIPTGHKDLLGMVGMHGSYAANMGLSEADLIICLGARFDDRVTGKLSEFAKNAKIIHIDIDPSSISKIVEVDYHIVGDLKSVVSRLNTELKDKININNYAKWRDTLMHYLDLYPMKYQDSDSVIKPQWVISQTAEIVGDEAFIVTDVGQHQMWTAQFFPFKHSRQFATSGGLGTMGYGFPAAIGAKVALPNRPVIAFSGDGGILMNIQELMSAVESKIPVINIILNNNFLGMVRQWQSFFYGSRFSNTDLSLQPDFVKLSESFGAVGYTCNTKNEFKDALQKALNSDKVSIIEVKVERFENVLPMVPAGAAIYNMILE